jgi:hypothetical protein
MRGRGAKYPDFLYYSISFLGTSAATFLSRARRPIDGSCATLGQPAYHLVEGAAADRLNFLPDLGLGGPAQSGPFRHATRRRLSCNGHTVGDRSIEQHFLSVGGFSRLWDKLAPGDGFHQGSSWPPLTVLSPGPRLAGTPPRGQEMGRIRWQVSGSAPSLLAPRPMRSKTILEMADEASLALRCERVDIGVVSS